MTSTTPWWSTSDDVTMPKPNRRSSSRSSLAVQRAARCRRASERLGVDDAFLGRPPERRAVRVLGAEVGVPGVQVRVEVHAARPDRVVCGDGPKQRAGRWCGSPPIGHQPGAVGGQIGGAAASMVSMALDECGTGLRRCRPASATWAISNGGDVHRGVVRPQQARRLLRMDVGPERAPGPVDTLESNGTPDDHDIGGST